MPRPGPALQDFWCPGATFCIILQENDGLYWKMTPPACRATLRCPAVGADDSVRPGLAGPTRPAEGSGPYETPIDRMPVGDSYPAYIFNGGDACEARAAGGVRGLGRSSQRSVRGRGSNGSGCGT